MPVKRVFVTGAAGYLGNQLLARLVRDGRDPNTVIGADVQDPHPSRRVEGVRYLKADVRDPGLGRLIGDFGADVVVHLASIVTPGPDSSRELEYAVDVEGSRNVLEGCVAHGVERVVVSSSGAAYGYHPDNPAWIREDWPVRGNESFAYAWHKRLVEEMLAEYRERHPQLRQFVFRIGTILGTTVRNQITNLFEKPRIIAIRGSDSPFVFVWDQDVVGALVRALDSDRPGIYNVAGDGALAIQEIADLLGKPVMEVSPGLLRASLAVLRRLGLTRYGPEQLDFLRYRPVLDNHRLKHEFGYQPAKTSREAFEVYLRSRTPNHGANDHG